MVAASNDKRNLSRLPCSVTVSEHAESGLVGEFRNISLDGGFIATGAPLPQGSVFPLIFRLEEKGPRIRADAEVVRTTDEGMGVHFISMRSQDARRLRRYVSELVSTIGSRENAERLLDVDSRVMKPITDVAKIQSILQGGTGPKVFTILPASRVAREQAHLAEMTGGVLQMSVDGASNLLAGEEVLVLHTHDFVSYFFRTEVHKVNGAQIEIRTPKELKYSERRASRREESIEDATIKFPVPWRKNEVVAWEVVERTSHGLSFRADPRDAFFWPGTELSGAIYSRQDKQESLTNPVVKNLTTMDEDGAAWLRVGIAFGAQRQSAAMSSAVEQEQSPPTFWSSLLLRLQRVLSALEYFYHSKFRLALGKQDVTPFSLVKFQNRGDKTVVGLLNTSFEPGGKRAVRAPLVVIAPGYGVRKETMSALALTLTHNFRRQHRDLAVLRFDGVNNLGESEKNPGFEGEGKHCIQWTISDGINDLLGALDWARNNRYVDPTNIVLITGSIGSVAARRVLTTDLGGDIAYWIAFHGAPDAGNTVMHAAGNIDLFGNFERGIKTGVISLMGCLGDADNFARDAYAIHAATLDDARREMAKIRADVTWIVGQHDAYVDKSRVRDIMSISAPADREIVEVNSGHMPRTSDEALSQFALITRHIWRRLYGRDVVANTPSHGWLAAVAAREWKRVRHGMPTDAHAWWKEYLLGNNGLGYDAWSFTPEYNQLINDQVDMVPRDAQKVLDLGAGTGNISQALIKKGFSDVTAVDLVPEALEKIKAKVGAGKVKTVAASIEGTPQVAMARWLKGELGSVDALVQRLPAGAQETLSRVSASLNGELLAILRGNNLPIADTLRRAKLPEGAADTLRDVQSLARLCRGIKPLHDSVSACTPAFNDVLRGGGCLPFADSEFDAVVCSIALSYIEHYEDALFEISRILKPGGTLVLSSMRPDADTGKAFLSGLELLQNLPDGSLPPGYSRESLVTALREFADHSAQLLRLEEEGAFHFWEGDTLTRMMQQAGFDDVAVTPTCGDPAMAVIVKCTKV